MRNTYALYFYNLSNLQLPAINYAPYVQDMRITTTAPGGFGTLDCTLFARESRIVPPELGAFSNVALMAGPQAASDGTGAVFLGRLSEPGIALSQADGTKFELHAEGWSANLTDDPGDYAYSARTVQFIVNDQFSRRAHYLIIDSDQSAVLPNAPTAIFNHAFNGETMESVFNTVQQELGDYIWTVYDHPTHKDAAGFPKAQLQFHVRDTATITYQAFDGDFADFDIKPATDIAYNVVEADYRDSTQNPPTPFAITVKDSRLNSDGSQGTAPFPWKKLRVDGGDLQITPTQATAAANAILTQYKSIGYRSTIKLSNVRNAQGVSIPLWQVRSDTNIFLPQLSPIGVTLPTGVAVNQNLFYIYDTSYDEPSSGTPILTLTCGDMRKGNPYQFEVLKRLGDHLGKKKRHAIIQAIGESEYGYCGIGAPSNALGGTVYEQGVNFKTQMASTPSSITLTAVASSNVASIATTNITQQGFQLQLTTNVNGTAFWRGHYRTNGN